MVIIKKTIPFYSDMLGSIAIGVVGLKAIYMSGADLLLELSVPVIASNDVVRPDEPAIVGIAGDGRFLELSISLPSTSQAVPHIADSHPYVVNPVPPDVMSLLPVCPSRTAQ